LTPHSGCLGSTPIAINPQFWFLLSGVRVVQIHVLATSIGTQSLGLT
jgi:hypothetical protein